MLLTPLVLAGTSYWVTFKINRQQQKNAHIIAKAQMENAEKLTEAEINVAKLGQIREEIDRNPYGENPLNILVEKYTLLPSELGK